MCDYIDYTTPNQQQDMFQLAELILNPTYNMQIIIDVALLDNPQLIRDFQKEPLRAFNNITLIPGMVPQSVRKCIQIYWK